MIAPGKWLGLLGGGQLGRMFCMAAQSMGYKVAVLDPDAVSPTAGVADHHIRADYVDEDGLAALASMVQAATTEFENVPAASLEYLASRIRIAPSAASVAVAQDRIREKAFLVASGCAVAPYAVLSSETDARGLDPALAPGIVKSARMGYDGKGQIRVQHVAEIAQVFAMMGGQPCVIERFVALAMEISVIVARSGDDVVTWPIAENRHRHGILDVSIVPARISDALANRARDLAMRVAAKLEYRGVLCVEMFVLQNGELLVNEIAPRPHNSGHYSIDACVTSQFEQQVRVLAELPLGDTRQQQPAVMVNLLGDVWFGDHGSTASGIADNASSDAAPELPTEPDWAAVLRHPSAKLHLYGKADPRRGRKMGHVTCVDADLSDAMATAHDIKKTLRIPIEGEL